EVARTLGVSRQTVSRWHQRWQADGTAGLQSRGAPGRAPQLSAAHLEQAEQALLKGAKAHGFDSDLWTLDRIAEVIWRVTGVRHHPAHVWRLLRHRLDSSLQPPAPPAPAKVCGVLPPPGKGSLNPPARRAKEREEPAIRQWVASDWPRIKKTP